MLDPDDRYGVADRAGDGGRVVTAARRRPEADADDAAGRGHAPELLVGQVPGVVGDAADARVRHDDGARRDRQGVVDRRRRRVRQVEQHRARLHPPDHLATEVGQAALVDAVRRAAEGGVEEVRRRHHPVARVDQPIDVVEIAVERVRALDREERRGRWRRRPPDEVGLEVGGRPEDREPPARASGRVVRPARQVERAFREAAPRRVAASPRPARGAGRRRSGRRCARCSGAAASWSTRP